MDSVSTAKAPGVLRSRDSLCSSSVGFASLLRCLLRRASRRTPAPFSPTRRLSGRAV